MRAQAILSQISKLANEEHEIWLRESHGEATQADRAQLQRIELTLDRCWDLLNRRRARRAGRLKSEEPQGARRSRNRAASFQAAVSGPGHRSEVQPTQNRTCA